MWPKTLLGGQGRYRKFSGVCGWRACMKIVVYRVRLKRGLTDI